MPGAETWSAKEYKGHIYTGDMTRGMDVFAFTTCDGASCLLTPTRVARRLSAGAAVLDELEAEAALDAEVAVGHRRVERRIDLHDRVVLDVEIERAADAAIRADRLGHRLGALVPGPGGAHVELGLEHQRARRADADAVAAVDARRIG